MVPGNFTWIMPHKYAIVVNPPGLAGCAVAAGGTARRGELHLRQFGGAAGSDARHQGSVPVWGGLCFAPVSLQGPAPHLAPLLTPSSPAPQGTLLLRSPLHPTRQWYIPLLRCCFSLSQRFSQAGERATALWAAHELQELLLGWCVIHRLVLVQMHRNIPATTGQSCCVSDTRGLGICVLPCAGCWVDVQGSLLLAIHP